VSVGCFMPLLSACGVVRLCDLSMDYLVLNLVSLGVGGIVPAQYRSVARCPIRADDGASMVQIVLRTMR